MKKLLLLVTLTAFCASVWAAELTKTQAGRVSKEVGEMLESQHFSKAPLDDAMSGVFLTNYLEALDFSHRYFLSGDIQEFQKKYATTLDDHIKNGDIAPAFEIYERFLKRVNERTDYVKVLLEKPIDYTKDETLIVRREKEPWPANDEEAKELWRKSIKAELLNLKLNKEKPERSLEIIRKRHERVARTYTKEFDGEEVIQLFLSSLAHGYDPHSDYMGPREAENFSINNITLSLSGIGARLQKEEEYTVVKDLMAGGPAKLSKLLKRNDRVLAVGQEEGDMVDVVDMPLKKVVDLIRGKKGTTVRLKVANQATPDQSRVISLVRDDVKITEQQAKAQVIDLPLGDNKTNRVGVINLPAFYANCADDVHLLIKRLKQEGLTSLILDLRHNGGGILDQAVELTGLFIKEGPVVQVKRANSDTLVLPDEDSLVAFDGPMVVLTSKLSASASEIVAAALQDHGRALIVGDQSTHGKGTVQTLTRPRGNRDSGEVKYTISKFYRVAGNTTQKIGVTPDVVLPSLYDFMEIGEATLPHALPADSIPAVDYSKLDRVKPFLNEILAKARERVQKDPEFNMLRDYTAIQKKRRDEKSVTLNESKRLAEIEETKTWNERLKAQQDKRGKPFENIYTLTLKQALANQPLAPYDPKAKDEEEEPEESLDAETVEFLTKDDFDPQLREAVHIIGDYTKLLSGLSGGKKGNKLVGGF